MARGFPPADQVEFGYYTYSSHLLALEVMRRDLPVTWLTRSLFLTTYERREYGFSGTRTDLNSSLAVKVTTQKQLTRKLLRRAGLSVARGASFQAEAEARALAYGRRLGYPLTVKPAAGGKGEGVTTRITSANQLAAAWKAATVNGRAGIVERHFDGADAARFLVIGQMCPAVAKKVPPALVCDGVRTVEELVEARNAERARRPELRQRLMKLDTAFRTELAGKGFSLTDVPTQGAELVFDQTSNTSRGAETADVTDVVHPSYRDIAVRAVAAIPGLGLAGVDVLGEDLTIEATPTNHIVVEVNGHPGLRSHHFPDRGEPRDVARLVVDHVFAYTPGRAGPSAAAPPRTGAAAWARGQVSRLRRPSADPA